jgi:hypothetical protein
MILRTYTLMKRPAHRRKYKRGLTTGSVCVIYKVVGFIASPISPSEGLHNLNDGESNEGIHTFHCNWSISALPRRPP